MRCSAEGCSSTAKSKGFCHPHYCRWRRYGDPLAGALRRDTPVADRLILGSRDEGDCRVWTGEIIWNGYGRLSFPGRRRVLAHRVSYETFVGPIPDGLELDHLCRNRPCIRPDHLEPVTPKENARRGWASRGVSDVRRQRPRRADGTFTSLAERDDAA